MFPRALIINCRRDPLDTCLSIAQTWFAPRTDFPADLADLPAYRADYARLCDHWRTVLGRDRFVDIDYEALVADPEPTARRLIAALGLEWDDACLSPEHNARLVRTSSKWQVRQPVHRASVGRWRAYRPWLGPLATLLPGDQDGP